MKPNKYIIAGWIGLILLFATVSALAVDDFRLGGFLRSNHPSSLRYNEDHRNSLYVYLDCVTFGFYENSYSNIARAGNKERYSRFLEYQWDLGSYSKFDFTGSMGIVDGYKGIVSDRQYLPFASLNVKFSFLKARQVGPISVLAWETPNLINRQSGYC